MDPALAGRIARQDAEALEMLGIDFVRVGVPKAAAAQPTARDDGLGDIRFSLADPPKRRLLGRREKKSAAPVVSERESRQQQLDEILARYEADAPHKHFPTDHHSIVFGDGDPCARLVFVGEAPGAEEDRAGIPFVGRSGELLNKMIVAMGLSREQVYICNVLKVRPPNNATPTPEQARLCSPYLYDQLRVIRPEAIVTLGLPASRLLLERMDSMGDMRGKWFDFPPPDGVCSVKEFGAAIPVMPTYHPAFLLRQNTVENRGKVWSDLKLVMARLGLAAPSRAR